MLIVICESLEIVQNDHLSDWTNFPASGQPDDSMQHEDLLRKLQVRIDIADSYMTVFILQSHFYN